MAAEATIVVHFGDEVDEASANVLVELDGVETNYDAEGNVKTSFFPGDEPHFVTQHGNSVRIDRIVATDGAVVSMGTVSRTRCEENILFTDQYNEEDENPLGQHELLAMPSGNASIEQHGRPANLTQDGRMMNAGIGTPFLVTLTYQARVELHRLIPPNLNHLGEDDNYSIFIVVYVEAA